jgi:uncharacterized membrane protein
MNKQEFLSQLRGALSNLPKNEVDEIMRDQEEYIRDAVQAGRSEADVIQSLGTPATFAAGLAAETKIQLAEESTTLKKQMGNTLGALLAVIAIAPVNILFMCIVIGPFLGVCGAIFGGWIAASGILIAAFGLMAALFGKLIFIPAGFWAHLSSMFFAFGGIGVGVLGLIFMVVVTKVFLQLTVSYLKWNLNFIRTRAA